MLGARTKQVVSYGKRNKRIVNVSDEMAYRTAKQEDPFRVVQPLTQSSNSQENDVAPRAPAPPKKVCVVVLPKRKRAPFVVSPSSVKNRMHPLKTVIKRDSGIGTGTSSRRPLGLISNNVPVTPVASVVSRKQAKPRISHTPQSSVKPISPFVNLDIIVTDDRGQRVSEEKRVFRTDMQINPLVSEPNTRVHGIFAPGKSDVINLCDSDEEVVLRPARAARKRVARQVVVSDDSDDDSISVLSSSKAASRLLSKGKDRPKPILIASSDSDGEVNTTKESRASNAIRVPRTRVPDPKPIRDPSGYRPLAMKIPPTPPVVMRSRQLTPIKRNNFSRPPLALSPTTPSSLDLSIDFEGLSLSPSLLDQPVEPQPRFILPLLQECGQTRPHEFSAFIETFPFDPIVHAAGGSGEVRFQKIGEASYSEVFGIGDVVLKVIPLRLEDAFNPFADLEKEGPAPSEAKDVLKEIIVTQTMGEICEGFVRLLRSYVVRGRYPSLLLDLWDKYAETKGSESVRPGPYPLLYAPVASSAHRRRLLQFITSLCDYSAAQWRARLGSFHFREHHEDGMETGLQHILAGHEGTGTGGRVGSV
jgi:serine/threonine-protein kinase haspin